MSYKPFGSLFVFISIKRIRIQLCTVKYSIHNFLKSIGSNRFIQHFEIVIIDRSAIHLFRLLGTLCSCLYTSKLPTVT